MLAEMLKADDKKPPEDQMDPEEKKKLQDALNSLKKDGAKGDQAGNLVSQVLQALGVPQGVADAIGSAVSQSGGDSDGGGGGIEQRLGRWLALSPASRKIQQKICQIFLSTARRQPHMERNQ